MKKISLIFLFCALVLVARSQSKDEGAVAAAVEKLRTAMISGNKVDLERLLSDELTYSHSNGKVEDKAIFVDGISTKKSDFKTIQLNDQSISVIGDVAVVRHILIADTNDGGKPANIHLGVVLVWKKIKAEWKLIARRAFLLPA